MANKRNRGFSLIELAIVMFIVSIILGGLLTPLSTRLESEKRKQTTTTLAQIRESLLGYTIINGHLPCPDCPDTTSGLCGSAGITADDGIEDGVESGAGVSPRAGHTFDSCAVDEGYLPWSTLGVPQYDAWENRFHYRVTDCFARDPDPVNCTTSTSGVSFALNSSGDIDIKDENGNWLARNVPAIVISFGANADDVGNPSSASEKENQNGDNIFVEEDYRSQGTNEFDDQMTWISPGTLMYKMISAQRLP